MRTRSRRPGPGEMLPAPIPGAPGVPVPGAPPDAASRRMAAAGSRIWPGRRPPRARPDRPAWRQIRLTADWLIPVSAAIRRVDHRRRPAGGASSARAITRATCSSVIVRGAPGRGASRSPASRSARNRDRHLRTVSRESPSSAATLETGRPPGRSGGPAAHASTILARIAKGPAAGSSAHAASRARSPAISTTGGDVGLIMPPAYRARMKL